MNKSKFFLALVLTISLIAFNVQCSVLRFSGAAHISDMVLNEEVAISGSGKIEKSTFKKLCTVSGSLDATEATFDEELVVAGSAKLQHGECKKLCTVTGRLEACDMIFADLSLNGEHVLTACKINNITVPLAGDIQPKKIRFVDTVVNGEIVIAPGQKVTICLEGTTKVVGKITGAVSVIKK